MVSPLLDLLGWGQAEQNKNPQDSQPETVNPENFTEYNLNGLTILDNKNARFQAKKDHIFNKDGVEIAADSSPVKSLIKKLGVKSINGLHLQRAEDYLAKFYPADTTDSTEYTPSGPEIGPDYATQMKFERVSESFIMEAIRQKNWKKPGHYTSSAMKELQWDGLIENDIHDIKTKTFETEKGKGYILTINGQYGLKHTTWVLKTKTGYATLQEFKDPDLGSHLRSVDLSGNESAAFLDIEGSFASDIVSATNYFNLFTQARIDMGGWDFSHIAALKPQSKKAILHFLSKKAIQSSSKYNGRYFPIQNHGGGVLALLANSKDNIGPDESFQMRDLGISGLPKFIKASNLFENLKYVIKMPTPEQAAQGRMPELTAGSNFKDCYKLIIYALKNVPIEQWSNKWITASGNEVSFHDIMQGMIIGYQYSNPVKGHFSHSHFHMPEMLLDYYRKTGASAEYFENLKQIFLNKELKADLDQLDAQGIAATASHHMQSLGYLLSAGEVTWTPEEIEQVQDWTQRALEYSLELTTEGDYDNEIAHFLVGLRKINAHLDKLQ